MRRTGPATCRRGRRNLQLLRVSQELCGTLRRGRYAGRLEHRGVVVQQRAASVTRNAVRLSARLAGCLDGRRDIREVIRGGGVGAVVEVRVERGHVSRGHEVRQVLGAVGEDVHPGVLGLQLQLDGLVDGRDRQLDKVHVDAGLGGELRHQGLVVIELWRCGVRLVRDRRSCVRLRRIPRARPTAG